MVNASDTLKSRANEVLELSEAKALYFRQSLVSPTSASHLYRHPIDVGADSPTPHAPRRKVIIPCRSFSKIR